MDGDPFADLTVTRRRKHRKKSAVRRKERHAKQKRDALSGEKHKKQVTTAVAGTAMGTAAAVRLVRSHVRYYFTAWRRRTFPRGLEVWRSRNAVAYDFAWLVFCRRRARNAAEQLRLKRHHFDRWRGVSAVEKTWRTYVSSKQIEAHATTDSDSARETFVMSRTASPRSPTVAPPPPVGAAASLTADDVGVGAGAQREYLRAHLRYFYGGGGGDAPTREQFFAAGRFSEEDLELMSRLIDPNEFL